MDFEERHIIDEPPGVEELCAMAKKSNGTIQPLINTKGTKYREMGLKDKSLGDEEWMELLSTDGMLVKRPILWTDRGVEAGFDAAKWKALL